MSERPFRISRELLIVLIVCAAVGLFGSWWVDHRWGARSLPPGSEEIKAEEQSDGNETDVLRSLENSRKVVFRSPSGSADRNSGEGCCQ